MALAYNAELHNEVRIAINADTEEEIGKIYFKIFSKTVKQNCNSCFNKAIEDLIKWTKKQYMGCKYKIASKYEGTVFTVNIGGTMHRVTNSNISNATAEIIMNNPNLKNDIIEINPDYKGEVEVKKNEVKSEPQPILSTLTEVLKDGKESEENVSEKRLVMNESVPLTVEKKKRGRPAKS